MFLWTPFLLVMNEKTHIIKTDILINPGESTELVVCVRVCVCVCVDWQAEFECFPYNVLKSNRKLQNILCISMGSHTVTCHILCMHYFCCRASALY